MTIRLPRGEESRAILVGAGKYRYLDNLPAVRNNLASLRDVLTDPGLGGLPSWRCKVVEDPPDPKTIYSALRRGAAETADTLIVYYAGHGLVSGPNNDLYLCARETDPDEVPVTALRFVDVREALRSSRSRTQTQLLILDCCFSGRAIPMMAGPESLVKRVEISGTYILTSTAANLEALAPPGERYTAFTGSLLALMRSGVPSGPALLTLPTLFPYLREALCRRGFPEPLQVSTQTVDTLAIVYNAAYRDTSNLVKKLSAPPGWNRALTGHKRAVYGIAFHPGGTLLASCANDKTVRIWDLDTHDELQKLTIGLAVAQFIITGFRDVEFDPSGKLLASCSKDGSIRIWDADRGKRLKTLTGHVGVVYSIAFHPSGALLASCAEDGTVRLWDPQTGKAIRILRGHTIRQTTNSDGTTSETGQVHDVAFAPLGRLLASCADDNTIRLWSPDDGQHLGTLTGHTSTVYGLAFHPTADLMASSSADSTVRLWNPNTGQQVAILKGHSGSVYSVAFNHDGDLLASCASDGTVRLWNPETGQQLQEFRGHAGGGVFGRAIYDVVFHPHKDVLVSCGQDRMIRFWGLA